MEVIIYKLYELQYMLIVELEEYISLIDYIVKNNFHQSLNFFYLFKNNNDHISDLYIIYKKYFYKKVYEEILELKIKQIL